MNNNGYPNRDALRKANDIYLDVMRSFIVHNLKQITGENVQQLIEDVLYDNQIDQFHQMLNEHNDIGSAIDSTYIPHIIKNYWEDIFADKFDNDLVSQSMLWLIRKGRNKCEHRATNDLDFEFTRTQIFLISDILNQINRSDKKNEVDEIRNQFLSDETTRQISEINDQLDNVETEKEQYKKLLSESEERFKELEKEQSENKERIDELLQIKEVKEQLEKDNSKLSKELKETEDAWNSAEMSLKSKEKQLNDEINAHDSLKEKVASLNEQIEATENENNRYKTKLDDEKKSNNKQLESMRDKYEVLEKEAEDYKVRLNVIEKQLHTTVLPVYPSYQIDSSARVLDRRNTDKRSYLTNLLEIKQPSIIYVESEEKAELFFTHIAGDKADSIGRHNEYSSETEERELLAKLSNSDLIAIVSNATFPTITEQHIIEHFVFCHPILDLDDFCKQCNPAFIPNQNTFLHLIYDTTQEFDSYSQELDEKYPEEELLRKLFQKLREHVNANGNSVKLELLCQELSMSKTGVEAGIAIFEELQFVERDEQGIKLLKSENRQLEESKIYSEGEKLKEKVNQEAYQLGMDSIENLWEKIHETLGGEKERIIHEQEVNTYRTNNGSQYEIEVDETDSAETEQVDTPKHSQAKVNAEQVRDIRERAADGESLSYLSKEYGVSTTAILNILNHNT